ncbi:MAG: DUF1552 domain-containing protein [Pseudomonadota bacterium]
MKRRQFIFHSAQSMMFLYPLLSIRFAEAQNSDVLRTFFFVDASSPYPDKSPGDFFPAAASGGNLKLPVILRGFEDVKNQMIVLDGVSFDKSGDNPKGQFHIAGMGKTLTAKNIYKHTNFHKGKARPDGIHGGPSIDHIIAQGQGVKSLESIVELAGNLKGEMRERPFSRGDRDAKVPLHSPIAIWDKVFKGFAPADQQTDTAKDQRLNQLKSEKSVLDSIVDDLSRFRRELVGIEKEKMDIHEDAIRSAEKDVARYIKDLEADGVTEESSLSCSTPNRDDSRYIPEIAKIQLNLFYTAFACRLIGVGGMCFGRSSSDWSYKWAGITQDLSEGEGHDRIWHKANNSTAISDWRKASYWTWTHLADFAKRLQSTPDGSGNMLNNTLLYGTSHFGAHHTVDRVPIVILGNAGGKLNTGRSLKVNSKNDKVMTSVARLAGVNISGIGNNLNCGPLRELYG